MQLSGLRTTNLYLLHRSWQLLENSSEVLIRLAYSCESSSPWVQSACSCATPGSVNPCVFISKLIPEWETSRWRCFQESSTGDLLLHCRAESFVPACHWRSCLTGDSLSLMRCKDNSPPTWGVKFLCSSAWFSVFLKPLYCSQHLCVQSS